ncbi:MAG: hypothetical protein Q8O67_04595 [Deltaproteobacteria bacterium]|nr:hypothetical protein [Deltaproteobacteria bacterium]
MATRSAKKAPAKKTTTKKAATPKKTAATTTDPPLVQGCLASAATALGRQYLQPGIGFDDDDDVLLALGWPQMIWLVPGDASARELADPKLFSSRHTFEVGPTPVGVVPRMLRHLYEYRKASQLSAAAINNNSPVDDDEATAFIDAFFDETFGYVCMFLLEAIRSPEWVLERLIDRWEKTPTELWHESEDQTHRPLATFGQGAPRAAHVLLLRCDVDVAASLRARMEKVYARVSKAEAFSRAIPALDLALHGRAGVERAGRRSGSGLDTKLTNDVVFALDDRAWMLEQTLAFVPEMKSRDRSNLAPRLAILGGEPVLKALAANIKGVHGESRESLAVGLSRLRSPTVKKIMEGLQCPTAKRWLKEH